MRSIISASVLLILIMLFVGWSSSYITAAGSRLSTLAASLPETPDDAYDAVLDLYGLWQSTSRTALLFCDREYIDAVDSAVTGLYYSVLSSDAEKYTASLYETRYEMTRLYNASKIKPWNIL